MLTEDGHHLTICRECDGDGFVAKYWECAVIGITGTRYEKFTYEPHAKCESCDGVGRVHDDDNCMHAECVPAAKQRNREVSDDEETA
jgi:DnaJ-class molecular chaperone